MGRGWIPDQVGNDKVSRHDGEESDRSLASCCAKATEDWKRRVFTMKIMKGLKVGEERRKGWLRRICAEREEKMDPCLRRGDNGWWWKVMGFVGR